MRSYTSKSKGPLDEFSTQVWLTACNIPHNGCYNTKCGFPRFPSHTATDHVFKDVKTRWTQLRRRRRRLHHHHQQQPSYSM